METAGPLRLVDAFEPIRDSRQSTTVKLDPVELMVAAVNVMLVDAGMFVEIEFWVEGKLEWPRGYLRPLHRIPSHDTFGRIFRLIDPDPFESTFRRWVRSIFTDSGHGDRNRRRQNQPAFDKSRHLAVTPGFGLCGRVRAGTRATGYG
jgi:DDE_Tnp_1-associated